MWLDRLKKIWRDIRLMYSYITIKNIVHRDVALSQAMIDAINDWKKMYIGQADWVTGSDYVKSLKIEQGICREFADVALSEMEASVDNERLDEIFKKCIEDINENFQDGLALGSMIIKPLGPDKAEFVSADKFIPISFDDSGKPNDCAFLTVKTIGENQYYTRCERHYLTPQGLTIENTAYYGQNKNDIGIRVPLDSVEEWKDLPESVLYPGMQRMDFGYYRNPVKNHVDGSVCGVSIYDSAIDLIHRADIQGARVDWEYESGERAIHVDERALKRKNGQVTMGKLNHRLYRGLNIEDGKDKELLREYSPQMRDDAYQRGLEKYFRQIEFSVGLAYGDLSDAQLVEKTATEIKTARLRKYNRVNAIQTKLQSCLEDFVAGMAFYNGMLNSGYSFSCVFHDSILTDEETERMQDRQDMTSGIMRKEEYRAKWYNESLEEALQNLPVQASLFPGEE